MAKNRGKTGGTTGTNQHGVVGVSRRRDGVGKSSRSNIKGLAEVVVQKPRGDESGDYPFIEGITVDATHDSAARLAYWKVLHTGLPSQHAANNAAMAAERRAFSVEEHGSIYGPQGALDGSRYGHNAALSLLQETAPGGRVRNYYAEGTAPGVLGTRESHTRTFGQMPVEHPDDIVLKGEGCRHCGETATQIGVCVNQCGVLSVGETD